LPVPVNVVRDVVTDSARVTLARGDVWMVIVRVLPLVTLWFLGAFDDGAGYRELVNLGWPS